MPENQHDSKESAAMATAMCLSFLAELLLINKIAIQANIFFYKSQAYVDTSN